MFQQLIRECLQVLIYYGNEHKCISGIITDYHARFDLIRISTHDMILPIQCITKIEIVEERATDLTLFRESVLRRDVDFDNAYFMAMPVSVWQDGMRIGEPGKIDWHDPEQAQIGQQVYDKRECTFRLEEYS